MEKKTQLVTNANQQTRNEEEFRINTTDDMLQLMDIYLSEWKHRDSMLWKQTFTFFVATLVVMILPFSNLWGIVTDGFLPKWIFPAIGVVLSIVFYIISKGYAIRLTAIGKSYNNLLEMLPKEFRRISIKEVTNRSIFIRNYSSLIVNLMFIGLLLLGITLLYLSL